MEKRLYIPEAFKGGFQERARKCWSVQSSCIKCTTNVYSQLQENQVRVEITGLKPKVLVLESYLTEDT